MARIRPLLIGLRVCVLPSYHDALDGNNMFDRNKARLRDAAGLGKFKRLIEEVRRPGGRGEAVLAALLAMCTSTFPTTLKFSRKYQDCCWSAEGKVRALAAPSEGATALSVPELTVVQCLE